MVSMQRQELDTPAAKKGWTELNTRIKSMVLVHEQLYQSGDFSQINFHEYLLNLATHLQLTFGRGDIDITVAAEGVTMNLNNAVPCGLFVNELLTNALRHAFPPGRRQSPNEKQKITVSASQRPTGYTLVVSDNGVGLPINYDFTTAKTLGLTLIHLLGRHQLQGKVELLSQPDGTGVCLRFSPKAQQKAPL